MGVVGQAGQESLFHEVWIAAPSGLESNINDAHGFIIFNSKEPVNSVFHQFLSHVWRILACATICFEQTGPASALSPPVKHKEWAHIRLLCLSTSCTDLILLQVPQQLTPLVSSTMSPRTPNSDRQSTLSEDSPEASCNFMPETHPPLMFISPRSTKHADHTAIPKTGLGTNSHEGTGVRRKCRPHHC